MNSLGGGPNGKGNIFIIFLTLIPLGEPPDDDFFHGASRPIGISRLNFMTFLESPASFDV